MYPLLLLPGLMNDARVWHPVVNEIEDGRTCVIFLTHLDEGVGGIARAAIQAMPPEPFCVAGFSLGGYVALEAFRQTADRIKGAALLSTGGRSDSEDSRASRQRMIEAAQSGPANFESATQQFLPRVLHSSHAADTGIRSTLIDMARSVGSDGFIRQQRTAIHRPAGLSTLKDVHVPALILCGSDDQISPLTLSQEMAEEIRDVELVVLSECGHMVTLEQPNETSKAMKRWLLRTDLAS